MVEVITSVKTPEGGWQWLDSRGNRLHSLAFDEELGRIVAMPNVCLSPSNVIWIENHDPDNGDPCVVRGQVIDLDGGKLTVTEPNGVRWIWMLEPATWNGDVGYFVGRWPD